MPFFRKKANLNFVLITKGLKSPLNRFGVGLTGKRRVEFGISCDRISLSWSRFSAEVDNVSSETRLPRESEIRRRKLRLITANLCPGWTAEKSFSAV